MGRARTREPVPALWARRGGGEDGRVDAERVRDARPAGRRGGGWRRRHGRRQLAGGEGGLDEEQVKGGELRAPQLCRSERPSTYAGIARNQALTCQSGGLPVHATASARAGRSDADRQAMPRNAVACTAGPLQQPFARIQLKVQDSIPTRSI